MNKLSKSIQVVLFFLFVLFESGTSFSQDQPVIPKDSSGTVIKVYSVRPFGVTLFSLSAGIGPFTAEARASTVEERIREISANPFFRPDSLHLLSIDGSVNIMYENLVVTTITAADTIQEKKSKEVIARERMHQIAATILNFREANRGTNILRSIFFSVVILILLVLLGILVNYFYRLSRKKIMGWKERHIRQVSLFGYEFLSKERQISFFLFLNKLLRALLFLVFLLSGLFIMFYILPWTKPFTLFVLEVILRPVKQILSAILGFLPNIIIICVILVITYFINRFFRFLKNEIEKGVLKVPGFYAEWALPTYNIIRVIVWIFTLIVIWPYIPGSDSKIFQGISVFLGLMFSFTSASLISNIMSGFSLTYTRAFQLGDRIKIGDVVGDVIEKSMLVTKVLTIKNEEVTIPNSKIMSSEVINYTTQAKERGLILYTSITIGYDAPWRKVHELLLAAAKQTEGLLQDPAPFVLQTSLDDFFISYQINAYTRESNRLSQLYSSLHQNIQDQFNEAGMEIMSPHYSALRDGNTVAIPENYRSSGNEAAGFQVILRKEKE
jgi:small-conductance mechanosensitive channel